MAMTAKGQAFPLTSAGLKGMGLVTPCQLRCLSPARLHASRRLVLCLWFAQGIANGRQGRLGQVFGTSCLQTAWTMQVQCFAMGAEEYAQQYSPWWLLHYRRRVKTGERITISNHYNNLTASRNRTLCPSASLKKYPSASSRVAS
jgi:hypothetical protein